MKWVTRARPKTDRIACPWVIRRFIDHDAEILYVPADQVLRVAAEQGGPSFDAKDATYTHRGNQCTFEVLIDEYHLGDDPALTRLARIVHAADISADLHTDPLRSAPDFSPSGKEDSPSRTTTSACWSVACSSTTPSTPGANSRSPMTQPSAGDHGRAGTCRPSGHR